LESSQFPYEVSLIIPFYNEEARVPLLFEGLKNFRQKYKHSYEVILVNDGSKDQSEAAVREHEHFKSLEADGKIKVITLPGNSGKGGALQKGVEAAQGRFILTLDFDMATDPMTIEDWKHSMGGKYDENAIWIGSRPHPKSKLQEKPLRKFVGIVFNAIIRLFTGLHIKDTQCGFKFYPNQIGKMIFAEMRVKGWAHDVEVLRRADLLGVPVHEMPVVWKAVDESKVSVVRDSIKMFLQTWHIAFGLFIYWGFIVPVKNFSKSEFGYLKTAKFPDYSTFRKEALYRFAFISVSVLILFLMPYLSKDYGISGDEWIQNDYGQKIYNYYFHGDDAVLSEEERSQGYEKIKYYSGGFELLAAIVYNTLDAENIWRVRHFIT
jgi:dolichyl-phosphate beta-glucosyltransferase